MIEKDTNGLFGWIEMTLLVTFLVLGILVTGKIAMDSLPILFVKNQLAFRLKSDLVLTGLLKLLILIMSKVC